jgi:hypothetical protein
MDGRKIDITIARCGLACEVCKHFNQECLGCEKENRLNNRCLIFHCAEEKNIQYCIQCQEFPCKFMVGLSKAYCPVYSEIKSKININQRTPNVCVTALQDRTPKHLLKISN